MQHPASCGNSLVRRYFRLRPLICRTFSADDSKQADNMYQTIESIQVQNVTSLGYCIPLFVHFPNTNVEIFLSYSAQRHLISSSSSFFSTAFSVFNLLFRASSIRFSARSFSASVISDSALRLPRLSTRPSMPFSLYFSHPGIDLLVADAESLNSSSVVIFILDAVADNFNPFFVCRSPYFLQIAAWLPSPLSG